ncbi:carbon-phosphorus lyase complex subunit PhnI [Enemella sp. A6]|uniref:carbon-phosphorus lyase complex subunit PhnI n=1 Tax=Enemella sp. A6 TaxID=3440152 RepID=UPI003EBA035A
MTYAGTSKGGTSAILAAEALVGEKPGHLDAATIADQFPAVVDRLMGEAGLWDPETAAAALAQAGGDLPEAVHLLRAHRSTLTRFAVTEPIDPDDVELLRRIVPAHRSPEGPQLLGETVDYTARLLRRPGEPAPLPPTDDLLEVAQADSVPADEVPPRYTSWLASQGLLVDRPANPDDPEPVDLARHAPRLPAPRSALLSSMAMAETGGLVNLWYRSILGPDGYADEAVTLGEVRHARVGVQVRHPHTGNPITVGTIRFSECETIAHLDERGEDPSRFEVGWGMTLGHNERKSIAMSAMDLAAHRFRGTVAGHELEQLLVLTTDGLASNGFLEHLKLPHYVTFRSQMDRAIAAGQELAEHDAERARFDTPEPVQEAS